MRSPAPDMKPRIHRPGSDNGRTETALAEALSAKRNADSTLRRRSSSQKSAFARAAAEPPLANLAASVLISPGNATIGLHFVVPAGSPAAAAESGGPSHTGTSRSGRAFRRVRCRRRRHPVAALDAGLAKGNPRRRLPDGSKGYLGVMVAVHDRPPRHTEQEDRSLRSAGAASRFPSERIPGHGRAPSGRTGCSPRRAPMHKHTVGQSHAGAHRGGKLRHARLIIAREAAVRYWNDPPSALR